MIHPHLKTVENAILYKCTVEGIINWSHIGILLELFPNSLLSTRCNMDFIYIEGFLERDAETNSTPKSALFDQTSCSEGKLW